MPVALRIENPLTLANESGSVIGSFDFGTTLISAGEARTVTASLAGKTVNQRVRLSNMRVSSPGSGTSTVTIPDTMILVDISPLALVATSALTTCTAHLGNVVSPGQDVEECMDQRGRSTLSSKPFNLQHPAPAPSRASPAVGAAL